MKELKCPHCHTLFTVNESDYSQLLAQVRGQEFDKELAQRLESEMKLQEARANSRFQEVLTKKEQAIQSLTNRLERIEQEQAYLRQQELAQKDKELLELHNQLDKLELEQQSRLQSALTVVEKERDHLKNQLVLQEKESELSLASVRSDYEVQLKAVNEQVEFYKNFKAQQSTKAIGESLELYAETEFNKVRSYAFPNASFTKDNQVSHRGSKGDYIYRELDSNGVEILSIMFEMKNEADTTKTKHKNSDFFKELDKDRREKNCEYAVLVTMLEADNDYYNAGIVDVSHDYDKMYVVRPQLFIHLIGLLRNAALNSLKYKQELALVREQHIDITHFEEDLEQFKHAFAKNYQSASNNFKKAIDEIDKSIKRMEEVKRFLTTSENQLRLANNKLDDVSVKKLTRNNPTMRDKFQAIKP
ncbi:TPA: DUF2130 domain-containing protein [Streptococcus equi subsp. zooepidemicus]|uniref:Serine/threonine-protein kinase MRCK beta n=1 Tax=Streptococcus equi subsp. zooepidemicus TaxID=40041 RepID=A0A7Z9D2L9_STRSZ|nr:DUF2130 domain-containing protein [Streptococcus equi]MCD3373754.1 DUF2130 domain-containing protein [Streptococcus equi subsp. zooepidemicus]MCD3406635.1 DUF2130 domain-containing protein [Streptococcus equi subsp. zooepidemicus]MCD3459929.1 DUF2130 domain-containing protein [Streptococcus equi subsp. zooepidemicus]MDI5900052.1 DUF2130 domain-containing protein [Streptococcus equi subsp. zooepidemicus]MDI5901735.1 DUF2130 domain-containing protein [Streptococcus equi subsp. zooepidemicus]